MKHIVAWTSTVILGLILTIPGAAQGGSANSDKPKPVNLPDAVAEKMWAVIHKDGNATNAEVEKRGYAFAMFLVDNSKEIDSNIIGVINRALNSPKVLNPPEIIIEGVGSGARACANAWVATLFTACDSDEANCVANNCSPGSAGALCRHDCFLTVWKPCAEAALGVLKFCLSGHS
jgi:hypothetical protein